MADRTLEDIVKVQLGLILDRKKADTGTPYIYRRLTLRAMESDGINPEATEHFYSKVPLQEEYLTSAGTIVMKLFSPLNPVVITRETEGYLFPSQMVSITPVKSVLPEYLCLYLTQDFVAKRLLANYFLIAQRAITVDSLLNLKVRIPSLKNQRLICDYNLNYRRLCRLRKELEKEEEAMMKYIFSVLSMDKRYKYDNQKGH
jgi:restriction endonuclease S subunit